MELTPSALVLIGLPLAGQLIEAHGGRLNIQSEKGAGTTATITLP